MPAGNTDAEEAPQTPSKSQTIRLSLSIHNLLCSSFTLQNTLARLGAAERDWTAPEKARIPSAWYESMDIIKYDEITEIESLVEKCSVLSGKRCGLD